tara:strand:+ start:667 stop:1347 length:681 start_codon:yes stop_codon:yes gene_type:complete
MNNLTAIILCGGKGMRLRPLTNDIPKPLVEINDKPILYYIINHLMKYEIKDLIIATGYKSEMIETFMKNNFSNIKYTIVNSGDVNILKRVKDCMEYINNDFLLCYGDTISNVNIKELISFQKTEGNLVTITSYPITIPFGVMKLNENKIVESFNEKPTLQSVMNIGYYYFPKNQFDLIKSNDDLIDVINKLIEKKLLRCFEHNQIHITINTLSELEYAEKNITQIF